MPLLTVLGKSTILTIEPDNFVTPSEPVGFFVVLMS